MIRWRYRFQKYNGNTNVSLTFKNKSMTMKQNQGTILQNVKVMRGKRATQNTGPRKNYIHERAVCKYCLDVNFIYLFEHFTIFIS